MKRVVITGMGAVTPIGHTVEDTWESLKAGANGIGSITHFDATDEKCLVGAEVKDWEYVDRRAAKRLDLVNQYSLTAGREAVAQSGIKSGENVDPTRFGIIGGSGIAGIRTLEEQVTKAAVKETTRYVSALMVPMMIINEVGGNLAIEHQAKGTCLGLATACSSGTHAIGEAYRTIKGGYADVMIGGAAEAPFAKISFAGFGNMTATTTRTDPARCSTPFDKERDGFVMGEGAGFFVLEELEHAKERGATILGEVAGYGTTCDAYHITAPDPDGDGAARAMAEALADADISADSIDYINAHGTGTPLNDLAEALAIKKVFGEDTRVPVSSTKGNIGHLLGAAGSVEAIFCLKAIHDGFIPPTIGYRVPDPEIDLDVVPNEGRSADLTYVMSNSLGFGGHNGTLILKKYSE